MSCYYQRSSCCNPCVQPVCQPVCQPACQNLCQPCAPVCPPVCIPQPITQVTYIANATPQSIPTGVNTVLNTFTIPTTTIGGVVFNIANGRFTVPVSGRYLISVFVAFDANVTGTRQVLLYAVNAAGTVTRLLAADSRANAGSIPTQITLSTVAKLEAGESVYAEAFQNSGVALQVSTSNVNQFALTRIC